MKFEKKKGKGQTATSRALRKPRAKQGVRPL